MITLLYSDTAPCDEAQFTEHYLNTIDATRRAKATAYKPEHDKRLNIAAGCLLQVGARLVTKGVDNDLITTGSDGIAALSYDDFLVLYEPMTLSYETGEFGKPVFTAGPEASFSLSHSKDAACVAFSTETVGADVQFHRPTHYERLAKRFFSEEEILFLHSVAQGKVKVPRDYTPQDVFHDLWAAKEAYVKYTGDGLFLPFDAFTVSLQYEPLAPLQGSVLDENGNRAELLFPLAVTGYSYCLCAEEMPDVSVLRVDFPAASQA